MLAKTMDQLKQDIKISLELFESLGFIINQEKSSSYSSTDILFFGVKFDLNHNKMSNSARLIDKEIKQAKDLQAEKFINRLMLERFVGLCNFMSYYMPNGRHKLNPIIKISNAYLPYSNRKLLLPNTENLKEALVQWTIPENFQQVQISNPLPEYSLVIDSSTTKWGASLIYHQGTLESQGG